MKHRNYPLLAAAILLFIAPACLAQTQFPDTPAGNQTKGMVGCFQCWRPREVQGVLSQEFPRSCGACCSSNGIASGERRFRTKEDRRVDTDKDRRSRSGTPF